MGSENGNKKIKVIDTNKAGWQSVNKDYEKDRNDPNWAKKAMEQYLRFNTYNAGKKGEDW